MLTHRGVKKTIQVHSTWKKGSGKTPNKQSNAAGGPLLSSAGLCIGQTSRASVRYMQRATTSRERYSLGDPWREGRVLQAREHTENAPRAP